MRTVFNIALFDSFGFGGSRAATVRCLVEFSGLAALVPATAPVFASCCPGISAAARGVFPGAQIFAQAAYSHAGRGAFAQRSVAMVQALASSPAPLWVCFPGRACPPGVVPAPAARCWSGGGSGSWAECAAAAGLSVPVLVFLPAGIVPPGTFGQWATLGAGWFFLPASLPAAPTLF